MVPEESGLSEALWVPATNNSLLVANCLLLDCLPFYSGHSAVNTISLLLDWFSAQPPPPPTIHVPSHIPSQERCIILKHYGNHMSRKGSGLAK